MDVLIHFFMDTVLKFEFPCGSRAIFSRYLNFGSEKMIPISDLNQVLKKSLHLGIALEWHWQA
jgi:hypothetical protein